MTGDPIFKPKIEQRVNYVFALGFPRAGGAVRDPLLPHAYLKRVRVSRGMGAKRYVCDNSDFSSLPRRKS